MPQTEGTNHFSAKITYATPKAVRFLQSNAKICMFIGGVRSSKTFTGVVKQLLIAIKYPRSQHLCGAPTFPMARDVCLETYRKVLTLFGFIEDKHWKLNKAELRLTLFNGSVILFRSGEHPQRCEGLTLDTFLIDEAAQTKKTFYNVLFDRISRTAVIPRGQGIITSTPKGQNWLFDTSLLALSDPENYFCETIFTRESGLVPQREIALARANMEAKMFRQQYEASFESWAGIVYDDFSVNSNVSSYNITFNNLLKTFIATDFGWTGACVALWYQYDAATDTIYLLDEFVETHISATTFRDVLMGEEVTLASGKFKAPCSINQVEKIVAGAEIHQQRQEANGLSMRQILSATTTESVGIPNWKFEVHRTPIFESLVAVRSYILSASGRVRLLVNKKCERYIKDKLSYHYPERDGKIQGELPDASPSNHEFSHTNDAERYFIYYLINYVIKSNNKYLR